MLVLICYFISQYSGYSSYNEISMIHFRYFLCSLFLYVTDGNRKIRERKVLKGTPPSDFCDFTSTEICVTPAIKYSILITVPMT